MAQTTSPLAQTKPKASSRGPLLAASIIGSAIVNVALFLIFQAAGATYQNTPGMPVGLTNVLIMTIVPLLSGLGTVALISLRWPRFITIGKWTGVALALLTIAMTATTGFDTLGFVALALMHVVVALAITIALRPAKTDPVKKP
jgi:Family of unknown function (DUF6069)